MKALAGDGAGSLAKTQVANGLQASSSFEIWQFLEDIKGILMPEKADEDVPADSQATGTADSQAPSPAKASP